MLSRNLDSAYAFKLLFCSCFCIQLALEEGPEFTNTIWHVVNGEPFELRFIFNGSSARIQMLLQMPSGPMTVYQLDVDALETSKTVTVDGPVDRSYSWKITDKDSGESDYSPVFELHSDDDFATASVVGPVSSPATSSAQSPTSVQVTRTSAQKTDSKTSTSGSSTVTTLATTITTSAKKQEQTSTAGNKSTATSSSEPDSKSSTNGLSADAKAGIGIGASVGGVVIFGLIGWFIYVRGKAAGSTSSAITSRIQDDAKEQAHVAKRWEKTLSVTEIGGNPVSEMGEWKKESSYQRVELP